MTSAAIRRRRSAIAAVAILALWWALPALGAPPAASPPSPPPKAPDPNADPSAGAPLAERLWHHRNLGKAFYENPTTQYEAVEELKKALDLAP
ncbi:MAG TPA: hypothetical protein VN783_11300, partial [Thermoanaerobaculia bacterium]|nr:hypothetical protein [Thermoanaerobaculia bacterium]